MIGLTTLQDESSKSGCLTFSWFNDGRTVGYCHGAGKVLPASPIEGKECISFMSCLNQTKSERYFIVAASKQSFNSLRPETYIQGFFFAIIRGIYFCNLRGSHMVQFHRAKHSVPICDIIRTHQQSSTEIVRRAFSPEAEEVVLSEHHFHYLSYICGPRAVAWTGGARPYDKDGRTLLQCGRQPDSWCMDDPFPGSSAQSYISPPDCSKLPGNYMKKSRNKLNAYTGAQNLRQQEGTTTRVVYIIPQKSSLVQGQFDEPPFLQVGWTHRESQYQLVAPITKSQRDKLYDDHRRNGPVSGEDFNAKLEECCAQTKSRPFLVYKLQLDKVRDRF